MRVYPCAADLPDVTLPRSEGEIKSRNTQSVARLAGYRCVNPPLGKSLGMDALETHTAQLTAGQYRARAEFIRKTAAKVTSGEKRRELTCVAEEYEWLAERIDRLRVSAYRRGLTNRLTGFP
jgi:hypothetical protein